MGRCHSYPVSSYSTTTITTHTDELQGLLITNQDPVGTMATESDDEYVPETPQSSSTSSPARSPPLATSTTQTQALPASSTSEGHVEALMETGDRTKAQDFANLMPSVPQLQPPSDVNQRFTMSGIHEKWQGITTSTSKCDVCRENRRGILYMCRQCSRNVCTTCIQEGNFGDKTDRKHRFDPENVVWKGPQAKARKEKPAKKATTGTRVTKTTKSADNGASAQAAGKGGRSNDRERSTSAHLSTTTNRGLENTPPEAFRPVNNPIHYTRQATGHQARSTRDKTPNMDNHYQAPDFRQSRPVSQNTATNTNIAASALVVMRTTPTSEAGFPPSSTVNHPMPVDRYSDEESCQQGMERRPNQPGFMHRSQRQVRYEPYENARRHRQISDANREEYRSCAHLDAPRAPLPPEYGMIRSNDRSRRLYHEDQSRDIVAPSNDDSRMHSTRSASISPETVIGSYAREDERQPARPAVRPHAQSPLPEPTRASLGHINPQVSQSQRYQDSLKLPSIRNVVTNASPAVSSDAQSSKTTLAPMAHVNQQGSQSDRHQDSAILPPIQHMVQCIPRSDPDAYQRHSRTDQHGASAGSTPPAADHTPRFMSPPIQKPPCSPLTKQEFPPAHTIEEAWRQWQIFFVHCDIVEHEKTHAEVYLFKHTGKLWEHLCLQSSLDVERKFKVLLTATWYAATRLGVMSLNNEATRWLKGLEKALLDQGYQIERSYLDEVRGDVERSPA